METYVYRSGVTSDANGPLDLIAELNYDNARPSAPIAVVMHGYSGTSGMCASVRGNAQYLRDKGFFAVSVALRGRDGADGVRDSGGIEIYDIYDAVEAVKRDFPALVDPATVYITGYSGGGGNTMAALTKFPDYFNAGAAFFGMSDYGYDLTNAWYFAGASSSHQSIMRTDVGNPTGGVAGVRDRYHARASNLASANNPYAEIHLYVNANETTCPPINLTTYLSNAVSREAYAGEFSNITVHIGQSGLYQDFNANGLDDADELQYWPHGAPTANQQAAAEAWFMARLLAGEIPRRALAATGTLHVAGFVKTARFECRVGDGQQGVIRLDYALSDTNLIFQAEVLSLDKQRVSRLAADTAAFSNQAVEVVLNGVEAGTFGGGGEWSTDALRDGDRLELRATGQPFSPPPVTPVFPKLRAYYDFETGLDDRTTNACHGTAVGTGGAAVTFTNQVPSALAGRGGRAVCLGGSGWIRLPFLNLYGQAQAGGVSFSLWVKSGVTNSSWMVAEGSTAGSNPAYCFGPPNTDRFRAYARTDANTVRLNAASAKAVFDDVWHHVVWTDLAGAGRVYVDGVPADAAAFSYSPGTLTLDTTTLGALERRPTDTKYPFTGWIDEFSVWDEVLCTNSIKALSAGVSPLVVAGLIPDGAQPPVRITGLHFDGTENVSLVFSGPTLAVQPRPWYTTNLLVPEWLPVPVLTGATQQGGVYTHSFKPAPAGPALFFKIVY